jgi:hypothetical protein
MKETIEQQQRRVRVKVVAWQLKSALTQSAHAIKHASQVLAHSLARGMHNGAIAAENDPPTAFNSICVGFKKVFWSAELI